MHTTLFNDISDVVALLQKAPQKTEEIFMRGDEAPLHLLDRLEK